MRYLFLIYFMLLIGCATIDTGGINDDHCYAKDCGYWVSQNVIMVQPVDFYYVQQGEVRFGSIHQEGHVLTYNPEPIVIANHPTIEIN